MKREAYKRKVDTQDKLFGRMLNDAARTKKRAHQLRLTTQVAKCTEVDSGIFKHLLQTVTNLLFLYNKFVISTLI
jgi:hypothetical protein